MAAKTTQIAVEIVANDEASPKIERLEKKIDGLEADEARITVSANTERLQDQLDAARIKLEGLDGDEASVQLRAVGTLEQDLEQAQTLLRQLDGKTGTVHITAIDTASKDLDQVSDKVRRLDGQVADVRTTAESTAGVGAGIGKTVGIAAITAALTDAIATANTLAGEVQQVADATGAPLDQASRLVTVWKQNGFEVSDLLDIIFQVNGALAQNPELAGQLGVKIGENQSLIDTFLQSVEGVGTAYENVADRQVAASTLFGEEGVRQIGAVTTSVGDLQSAMDKLPEAQTITPEDVERWRETNAQIVEFQGHLLEVQLFLSQNILPVVNDIADGLGKWFDWVGKAGEATQGFFDKLPDLPWVGQSNVHLTEQGVIARNTGGGLAAIPFGPETSPLLRQATGQIVTIINPPGTPAATADNFNTFLARNGSR